MTLAWYGHLRFKGTTSLVAAILVSWLIALPEYALQVPANRIGFGHFSAYELKVIQECITLVVFMGFAWFWLGETLTWRYGVAFGLILAAVAVVFYKPTA